LGTRRSVVPPWAGVALLSAVATVAVAAGAEPAVAISRNATLAITLAGESGADEFRTVDLVVSTIFSLPAAVAASASLCVFFVWRPAAVAAIVDRVFTIGPAVGDVH
jgi:hypothetical protein